MADILLDEESAPASPAAGQGVIWPDNAISLPAYKDDSGRAYGIGGGFNGTPATAAQTLGTVDTYVTGSKVIIPSFGLQVGSIYIVRLSLSRSGAGTATPIWTIRLGTAGTTSDTLQWQHTGIAQTGVAETGFYEFWGTIRSIGASGVLQGSLTVARTGGTAATGLSSVPIVELTGVAADKTWASGQVIGMSINPGATSTWVVTQCVGQLLS